MGGGAVGSLGWGQLRWGDPGGALTLGRGRGCFRAQRKKQPGSCRRKGGLFLSSTMEHIAKSGRIRRATKKVQTPLTMNCVL